MIDNPLHLDYQVPAPPVRCDWRALIVATVIGLPTGVAVGFAGFAVIIFGPLASFLVGLLVAYAARSKKVLYALFGGLVVGVAAFIWPSIRNISDGSSSVSQSAVLLSLFVPVWFVLPAAVGGGIVRWGRGITQHCTGPARRNGPRGLNAGRRRAGQ